MYDHYNLESESNGTSLTAQSDLTLFTGPTGFTTHILTEHSSEFDSDYFKFTTNSSVQMMILEVLSNGIEKLEVISGNGTSVLSRINQS